MRLSLLNFHPVDRAKVSNKVILIMLGLRVLSEPTANISFLLLGLYAMSGRAQAIQSLFLLWLFGMLSSGIVPSATYSGVARYVVIVAAAVSVFGRKRRMRFNKTSKTLMVMTLLLGLFFIVHSTLVSPYVDVSVLKAISWTIVMNTLIVAWGELSTDQRDMLSKWIFSALVLIMLVSLPLLALPLGYLRNGSGFQGILSHPQVFGPTMTILAAWGVSNMFAYRRPPWAYLLLALLCLILIVLSESRTAGVALILGVGISLVTVSNLSGRPLVQVLPGLRSPQVSLAAMFALFGVILVGPMLAGPLNDYIAKKANTINLIEAYEDSRGGLMESMWENIEENPLQGIGFGIASDPLSMNIKRDPYLGLPTGAAIEKGVLPVAILEEVGAVGLLFVAGWLWLLLRSSSRGGVVPLAVALTVLLLNMGESTLFSPGGMGMLPLVVLGWAIACSQNVTKLNVRS